MRKKSHKKNKKLVHHNENIKIISHSTHVHSGKRLEQLFKRREELRQTIDVLIKRNDEKLNNNIQDKTLQMETIDSKIMDILIQAQITNPTLVKEYTDAQIDVLEKEVVKTYNKKIDDLKDELQDDIISAVTGDKTGTTDNKFLNVIKNKLKNKNSKFTSKYNNVSDMMKDEDERISQVNKIKSSFKKVKDVKSFSGRKQRMVSKFKAKIFRLNPLKTRKGIQAHIEYLEGEKEILEDYVTRLKHSRFIMSSKAGRRKKLINTMRQIKNIDKIIEQNQLMLLKTSTGVLDKIKNLKYIKLNERKVTKDDVNSYISEQKNKKKSKLKNIDKAIEIVEELDKAQNKIINSGDLKRVVEVNEQIRNELEGIKENQIIEQDTKNKKIFNHNINKISPSKMQAAVVKPEGIGALGIAAMLAGAAPFLYQYAEDAVNNYMKDHFGFDLSHETKTTMAKKVQFAAKTPKAIVATSKLLLSTKLGIKTSQAVKNTKIVKTGVNAAKKISTAGKIVKNSKIVTGATKTAKDLLSISRSISKSLSITRLAGETTKELTRRVAAKLMEKTIVKKLSTKIPGGLGVAIGFGLAYARYENGEYAKAVGEIVSTILAIFPGVGTALSFAVDAIIIWSDIDEIMDRILAEEAAERAKNRIKKQAYIQATVSKKLSSSKTYKKLNDIHQSNVQAFNKYIQSGGKANDTKGKQLIDAMNKSGKGINDYEKGINAEVEKNYDLKTTNISTGVIDNRNYGVGPIEVGNKSIKYPNGMIKKDGSKSWRNNNPGNIRYSKLTLSYGAIGADKGKFAVFPSYKIGREALRSLLFNSKVYLGLNAVQAISKYAPASDNNDTLGYQKFIISNLGSISTKLLSNLSPKEQDIFMNAIQKREGYILGVVINSKTGQVVKNPLQPVSSTQSSFTTTVSKYSGYFTNIGAGNLGASPGTTANVGAGNLGTSVGGGVANMAKALVGKIKYVWGGKQGNKDGIIGLDCSGFVQHVVRTQRGIKDFPGSTSTQRSWLNNPKNAIKVNINQLQSEDIVFFHNGGHVGIYVGNDTVVHSSGGSRNTSWNPGKGVTSSKFSLMIKRLPFFAAYRIIQGSGGTQVTKNDNKVVENSLNNTNQDNQNTQTKIGKNTKINVNKKNREYLMNSVSQNLAKTTSSYDKKKSGSDTQQMNTQKINVSSINNIKEEVNSYLSTFSEPTVKI